MDRAPIPEEKTLVPWNADEGTRKAANGHAPLFPSPPAPLMGPRRQITDHLYPPSYLLPDANGEDGADAFEMVDMGTALEEDEESLNVMRRRNPGAGPDAVGQNEEVDEGSQIPGTHRLDDRFRCLYERLVQRAGDGQNRLRRSDLYHEMIEANHSLGRGWVPIPVYWILPSHEFVFMLEEDRLIIDDKIHRATIKAQLRYREKAPAHASPDAALEPLNYIVAKWGPVWAVHAVYIEHYVECFWRILCANRLAVVPLHLDEDRDEPTQ